MKPTLIVLAAGMGSRYGGLKQIDPVGPHGEVVLDYSVYDAIRAGFGRVVFIIRRDLEDAFRSALGTRYEGKIEVSYVFQELDALPEGFELPPSRVKPWGTAHALWCCRNAVHEPFAVINADDFYGARSFQLLGECLRGMADAANRYAMVGFELGRTLSPFGSVSRGVCQTNEKGELVEVTETHGIQLKDGRIDSDGSSIPLKADTPVSMNTWAFSVDFLAYCDSALKAFLSNLSNPEKEEVYIPFIVDDLIQQQEVVVKMLPCDEQWMGVTYPDDKPAVERGIQELIQEGIYPEALWG